MKKIIIVIVFLFNIIISNAQWKKIYDISSLPFITLDGKNIVMGASQKYVFLLSTDNGDTWKNINDGLPTGGGGCIYNGIIYSNREDSNLNYNLFISKNLGKSWDIITKIADASANDVIYGLRAREYYNGILYYGSDIGFFISSDNGYNWQHIGQDAYGIPKLNFPDSQFGFAFIDSSIYVVSFYHIYKSTDNCNTWKIISDGLYDAISAGSIQMISAGKNIVVDLNGNSKSYLSITTNDGESWERINDCCISKNVISIASCGEYIYAASDSGVFFSSDNGKNWKNVSYGTLDKIVNDNPYVSPGPYALIQINDDYIFIPTWHGLYRAKLKDCMIDTTETSVSEPQNPSTELTISPNPASDMLNINGNINNFPIKIYNIEGIKQIEAENTKEIDISKLPQGVYYIQIGNYFTKFVKI